MGLRAECMEFVVRPGVWVNVIVLEVQFQYYTKNDLGVL